MANTFPVPLVQTQHHPSPSLHFMQRLQNPLIVAVVADMAPMLTELSLHHNSSSCSAIQKQIVEQRQQKQNDREQTQTIREFLACLEEERKKIEGFERELPLCMQLLSNGTHLFCFNYFLIDFFYDLFLFLQQKSSVASSNSRCTTRSRGNGRCRRRLGIVEPIV